MNTIVTSKEDILKNSRELIREKGWAAVSIRSVASACGVSVGSIYNYYDSKAELISATVESVWCEIFSILSPFHGREYFEMCRKNNTVFQTYGVLEEGFLTSPAFLDKEFAKTDIRSRLPWVAPEKKEGLRRAFALWAPMCEEYHCSYAALVEAWALSQYDRMSLLVGMRRASSVEDTAKCLDIRLKAEDIKRMEEAVKAIQVAVLDK